MTDWGAPQWVLATILVLDVVVPPLARWAFMAVGYTARNNLIEYAGIRAADLISKALLVGILVWGGFF